MGSGHWNCKINFWCQICHGQVRLWSSRGPRKIMCRKFVSRTPCNLLRVLLPPKLGSSILGKGKINHAWVCTPMAPKRVQGFDTYHLCHQSRDLTCHSTVTCFVSSTDSFLTLVTVFSTVNLWHRLSEKAPDTYKFQSSIINIIQKEKDEGNGHETEDNSFFIRAIKHNVMAGSFNSITRA